MIDTKYKLTNNQCRLLLFQFVREGGLKHFFSETTPEQFHPIMVITPFGKMFSFKVEIQL